MITRRRFLQLSGFTSGLGLTAGLYTWKWEPHWLEIIERPMPLANLPQALVGARLVQLSDLHVGPRVDDRYLLETFQRVRSLAPEFVVYTGDFTCYAEDVFEHARKIFPYLPVGRLGTFGVLGNHDYGPSWAHPEIAHKIAKLASDASVRILRNEAVEVAGLQVVGLDDLWAGQFKPASAMSALRPGEAALVLSHNPDTADEPVWGSYSGWILSGHTHGGQCKPPFLPPPLLPVKNRLYTAGDYSLPGGRRLYINRGVGHLLQVRFNVRPEVTVFHLTQA